MNENFEFETEELEEAFEEETRRGSGSRRGASRARPQLNRARPGLGGPRFSRSRPPLGRSPFSRPRSGFGRPRFGGGGLPRAGFRQPGSRFQIGGPRGPRGPFGSLPRRNLGRFAFGGRGPGQRGPFGGPPQRGPVGLRNRFRRRRFLLDGLAGPVLGVGGTPGAADGGERGRWVQDCLNQVMQTQLPVTGVMDAATRSAVRSFQQQQNLRVTGIVGPDTEEALRQACSGGAAAASQDSGAAEPAAAPAEGAAAPAASEFEFEEEAFIGDLIGQATSRMRIIDLTAKSDKRLRKGTRDAKAVDALVLHQMACCFRPKDPLQRFLSLRAHFAVLPDGRILQVHPITALLHASHRFNDRSVAIEFAGNFPDIRGKWSEAKKFGANRPTKEQLEAGRFLVRHLNKTAGITHVFTHSQTTTKTNDPGPEVWSAVGQWAVDTLGMNDGGAGFKVSNGTPIPAAWRTWNRSSTAQELEEEQEEEHESSCGCRKCRGSGSRGRWVREGEQITLLRV